MWNETQRDAWRRIVDHVHASGSAKIGLQLGHAGRKGATRLPHQGVDLPLSEGGWPLVAPSALPYLPGVSQTPKAMDRADMEQVIEAFVRGARLAAEAGFDLLELHAAHGYLLSSFLSPLTNRRTDEYGGALAARAKFPLEVFRAVREAWPTERPMSVRISAHDWVHGGNTPEDAVLIARLFADAGVDIVHVSSGQVSPDEKPVYGRMFQVPFADRIRNETGIPTIAVGNISEADQVNTIIAAGRADLCALARPHLSDPAWTLHAAAELGYPMSWPRQYEAARLMLTRQVQRNQLMQSV
jgi:anthraniloyl-CoA monooxygenase